MDFSALGRKLHILPKTERTPNPQSTSTGATPQRVDSFLAGLAPPLKVKTKTAGTAEARPPPRKSLNLFHSQATKAGNSAAASRHDAAQALFASERKPAKSLDGATLKFLSAHECYEIVGKFMEAAQAQAAHTRDPQSLKDTFTILQGLQIKSKDHLVTACIVDGLPVGLIATSAPHNDPRLAMKDRHLTVEAIVTMPGASGRGAALMEHAAEMSQAAGCGGNLSLKAYPKAQQAYKAWGFEETEKGDSMLTPMSLHPSKSDKWCQIGERWRLRKNAPPESSAPGGPAAASRRA